MVVERKTRREYLTVEAIEPGTGKLTPVLISHDRLRLVGRRSRGQALECGEFVPMVLRRPSAVFEGLCTDKDEPRGRGYGWRCYCGRLSYAYNEEGKRIPPWPNEVFLVFVTDERVAYLWYWSKCDPEDNTLPQGYQTRFKKRVL